MYSDSYLLSSYLQHHRSERYGMCVCTSKVAVIFIRGGGTHHPNTECFAAAPREVKADS